MLLNKDRKKIDKDQVKDEAMLLFLNDHRKSFFYKKFVTSVMAAFLIGLIIGVVVLPAIGLNNSPLAETSILTGNNPNTDIQKESFKDKRSYTKLELLNENRPVAYESDFDSNFNSEQKLLYKNVNFSTPTEYSSVSFLKVQDKPHKNTLSRSRNTRKKFKSKVLAPKTQNVVSSNVLKSFDKTDGASNLLMQRYKLQRHDKSASALQANFEKQNDDLLDQLTNDIYWGPTIEEHLPVGSSRQVLQDWKTYVNSNTTKVIKIERGCGRMQNRLVTFSDGVKACVRYRINTDQVQGELFSFLLGQLLNITNLVPSCAAVVNWDDGLWLDAREYMEDTQWKTSKPVVLTKFIGDLEPSGIPEAFRPVDRHLNIDDVRCLLMEDTVQKPSQVLIDRLKSNGATDRSESLQHAWNSRPAVLSEKKLEVFVELAQWSDLIVFDYLIANLDRVVNNLYNYQWNHEILAAPAHNLAKQRGSQLLVFLDNESGLLHGYRLLNKYEAYHNLLLDSLCIFRKPTIDALKMLNENNPGKVLHDLFRLVTSNTIRHEIPPLPEKSLKILSDRIERVLQQVRKCQNIYSSS